MRELFRHLSSWLLFIGVAVSFFAFLNAADIYQNVQMAVNEINEYKYKSMYGIYVSEYLDGFDMLECLEELPGNVICVGNYVYIDKLDKYQECEILIRASESITYPVEEIDNDGNVYIGKKMASSCYAKNNKTYIDIEGKPYLVAGIISSEKTDILNYKIVIWDDKELLNKVIKNGFLSLECGSNLYNCENDIYKFHEEYHNEMNINYKSISTKHIDVGSENADEDFYMAISIFAIINCIVISEFWILRRKKEIVIRKLVGFTNIKLFFLIYRQMTTISTMAVASVLIIEKLISFIGLIDFVMSVNKIVVACTFVIISSLILAAIPVNKASKFRIEEGLEMI